MNNNKPLLFVILASFIAFLACNNPTESTQPPKLEVANDIQACTGSVKPEIRAVLLVGYTFENITIEVGESMTFTLADGMPAGLENIEVQVQGVYGNYFTPKLDVDFTEGKTTKIKLVTSGGCNRTEFILVNG